MAHNILRDGEVIYSIVSYECAKRTLEGMREYNSESVFTMESRRAVYHVPTFGNATHYRKPCTLKKFVFACAWLAGSAPKG